MWVLQLRGNSSHLLFCSCFRFKRRLLTDAVRTHRTSFTLLNILTEPPNFKLNLKFCYFPAVFHMRIAKLPTVNHDLKRLSRNFPSCPGAKNCWSYKRKLITSLLSRHAFNHARYEFLTKTNTSGNCVKTGSIYAF